MNVGTLVKSRVRGMEDKKRKGRSRRARIDVAGCVQDVIRKKKYLVKFEY